MKDFLGYVDPYLSTKKGYNLLRLFSPTKCMICGEIDSIDEGPFCEKCHNTFLDICSTTCKKCGETNGNCKCVKYHGIDEAISVFWYDKIKCFEIITWVKYAGEKRYISYLGMLLAKKIQNSKIPKKFDAICYVPRTMENLKKRGFDQSKILAETISFYLKIPIVPCLKRKGKSAEQKKLSGKERVKNVRNKYRVDKKLLSDKYGVLPRRILLIDDVITTGSTITECSYLLRKAGVRHVYVAALSESAFRKTTYKRKKK
jgi:ComF family protein